MTKLNGSDNQLFDELETKADEELKGLKDKAERVNSTVDNSKQSIRIYIDGGFDLMHSGHYNAIR